MFADLATSSGRGGKKKKKSSYEGLFCVQAVALAALKSPVSKGRRPRTNSILLIWALLIVQALATPN